MSVVALLLALAGVLFAVLDVRVAAVCLLGAAALAGLALVRGHGVWTARGALALTLAGALLAGWETWELRRPPADDTPSLTTGRPAGPDREVLLPLTIEPAPITRLALLEFVDGADLVYDGLEPQFIDRGHERGIRIIAYRHDGHTDLYDDLALTPEPEEDSRVTGKGRLHYRHTDLGAPVLEVDERGRVHIEFSFVDVEGRRITGILHERATRRPVPLNLLAPVGLSSTDPEYFPLFLLHDFDFLRLDADLDVTVDEQPVDLADFPVPLPVQGQRRSFAKYTVEPEIVAVFPTGTSHLRQVTTVGDLYRDGDATYVFDGARLDRIVAGSTEFDFRPALDLASTSRGAFSMTSHPEMGRIRGRYGVDADGPTTRLTIDLDEVEVPRQRGLLYRLIVRDSSVFGRWPTAYRYEATIDRDAHTIAATWTNENPGG